MTDLQIEATKWTPFVAVASDKGKIVIRGKSSPEAAVKFYFPIIADVKRIFEKYKGKVVVDLSLEYFNTSSSKCIFDLLRTLKRLESNASVQVSVNWFYESGDDDMLETGEDFAEVLDIPFQYIEVEDVEFPTSMTA